MENHRDWEKIVRRLEQLLRLKSFPVAFKMLTDRADLDTIPFLRRMEKKVTLCQMITLARNFDWTVGAVAEDFLTPTCPSIVGLADIPEVNKDGTFRSIVWVRTREEARKFEAAIPRLPLGKYQAVTLAPLVYKPFEPDLVLIYANPAQMILLINALQFEDYEVMQFYCVGESSCADAIARAFLTGKPSLTIPCYGERRYGHAQDEDLVLALPPDDLEKALRGLEALYRRGIRYPISYAGAEQDLGRAFPGSYQSLGQLEAIRGKDRRLLLGVTGGIATGKSTVVRLLAEKGAPVIDFDLLARKVVEPGQPAWKDIVAYFGEQVLQEDRTLDRGKFSDLVFRDLEKRKKLEGFTHPRILGEFIAELNAIVAQDPEAIIQVDVPLLIELNLQYLFHHILVVHVPREVQINRLMVREGIGREEALVRLKAQLPIDEKVSYADFVIHNEGTLEETRRQVDELWEKLKQIQKDKKPNQG
ncbi:MAG: dephospho-CoA kinase [Deltaproteobacteria bacterium]|nr:dephospho-CoA kinase [Deltaproteobacteria bacterium]